MLLRQGRADEGWAVLEEALALAGRTGEGLYEAELHRLRGELLNEYNIEIGGGQGAMAGKLWRVGLMGYSSHPRNILALLVALDDLLKRQGFRADGPAAVGAATEALNRGR